MVQNFKAAYILDCISQSIVNHFDKDSIFNIEVSENEKLNNVKGLLQHVSAFE